jgi:queuine tRNA-ribosyltransferase
MSFFSIIKEDQGSRARTGIIHTLHGDLKTPVLMTVGTKATVKGITPRMLEEIGVQVVLANTYHLHLNPTSELIAEMGGLHKFMNWPGPIFTDSGGFQVFSMGHGTVSDEIKGRGNRHKTKTLLEISEAGARFRSYLDGSEHLLSPERSMQIQHNLGADMIAAFDECTPFHVEKSYTKASMAMTHRWLDRSIAELKRLNSPQALFGIIQGGVYPDLRKISTNYIAQSNTPGICIGGSLGQNKKQMYEVVKMVTQMLPKEKPVHLLGIGDLDDLVIGVENGIDSFDCVTPTRNARHGVVYSRAGGVNYKLQITNSRFKSDKSSIDPGCSCYVCSNFSRSYLRYLLKAKEMLGYTLCSYHNIYFITDFMRQIRAAINEERFGEFKKEWGFQDSSFKT